MATRNNFDFWCPIEISKAIDPNTGAEIMRMGGIASTSDEDSDGEFLDPKGFDIKPLVESGVVNWHHQSKGQPSAIVGEPSKAEIRAEGLYLETDLYPSSKIAQDIWQLAKTLDSDSKTRRLGYSIEGKVVKRKSNDKNSPDYKKIVKAIITGVAITHQPKNAQTFANIIKGEIDEEDGDCDTETKSLDTESGAALKKESVNKKIKNQTFSKSEVIEMLFRKIPSINIEKAEKIHEILLKLSTMANRKRINDEDITKAMQALGLDDAEDITKGELSEEADETAADKKPIKKSKVVAKAEKPKEDDEDEVEETEETDEEDETPAKMKKGGVNRFDRIEKAIAASHLQQKNFIKATAVLIKDASNKLDAAAERNIELMDIIKAQDETIGVMSEKLEQFGSAVPAPKSLRNAAPVERAFAKGNEDELGSEGGGKKSNQVSMTRQKPVVSNLLDQATFSKGFDEEFSKACLHFEASGNLPADIIARMKNEFGVEITK